MSSTIRFPLNIHHPTSTSTSKTVKPVGIGFIALINRKSNRFLNCKSSSLFSVLSTIEFGFTDRCLFQQQLLHPTSTYLIIVGTLRFACCPTIASCAPTCNYDFWSKV